MKRKCLSNLVDGIDGMRRNQPMQYESLTYDIIGCAYKVYNTLGFGFLESIYKSALIGELTKAGLQFDV
jgi:hypothetical protein